MRYELHLGDCLEVMRTLPDASVDCVLTDPPYGTTACKWDSVVPFEPMWKELKRIAKRRAAICLFGSQPFTSALVMSNPKMFRYEWVWEKNKGGNFQIVKFVPFKVHENICIFYYEYPVYNAQREARTESGANRLKYSIPSKRGVHPVTNRAVITGERNPDRAPTSIKKFNCEMGLHPSQKPVELLRYLIRTYTNEGEIVLDFTMGSGSTGAACFLENRKFIGIEKNENYFEIAKARIEGLEKQEPLFMEQAA